jgi:hypothetical protein
MFNRILITLLLLTFVISGFNFSGKNPKITSGEIIEHIKYLSSDALAGRFPGTKGDSLTEAYIINELKSYKIKPAGENGYKQPFTFTSEIKPGENNKLILNGASAMAGDDFLPVYLSSNSSAEGNVVFVGYGINAPELNYNDYSGIDLKGKIALMFLYSPGYNNPHDNPFGKYERLGTKCRAAKEQGAAGVIVIKGPESGEDELLKLRMFGAPENTGIPVISVKRNLAEPVFSAAGKNMRELQKEIDSLRAPKSFETGGIAGINADLIYVQANTANIIAFIEGNDPQLKNETVIIGAHMDHLGDGMKYGSLYEKHTPEIHNGADDNASGTAGVLELAEYFSAKKKDLKRSILFIFFSGEEAGTIGSLYFTKSELFKKYNFSAMINLDMIGRLNENKLTIGGTGTSSIWVPLLDSLNKSYSFNAVYDKDGYGPSDHASFYAKDLPVLFFFTGLHKQYHRPDDDWELINSDGTAKVVSMAADIVSYIDKMPSKMDFVKVQTEKKETNMGFRVTLGIIPDYSSTKEGLEITGVKSGGTADKGGLAAGDVIIKLGKYEIKNIYDYTDALSKFKPGEETEVVVMRGTEEMKFKLTFAK